MRIKNKLVSIFFVITLALSFIFLLLVFINQKKMFHKHCDKIKNERLQELDKTIINSLFTYKLTEIDSLKYFTGKYLIIRIVENSCYACLSDFYEFINNELALKSNKLVLLTSFNDERELALFKSRMKLKVVNIPGFHVHISYEEQNTPYFFIIENSRLKFPFLSVGDKRTISTYLKNALEYVEEN